MADQNSQLISEFISVTGVDENRAKFYLQSANWELHTALATFYDDDPDDVVAVDPQSHTSSSNINDETSSAPPSSSSSRGSKSQPSRFATISQFQRENDSSGDEGQAFYAGGSERSGQQIIGPDKKKNPTQALFDAAKQHGAQVVEDHAPSSSAKTKHIFQGAGYTLGSNVEPSHQVGATLNPGDIQAEPKNVKIKFWKNGFSVDNGPLKDFNDPVNKEFLDDIARGEIPRELRAEVHGGEVHVDMEDHREEDFVLPKEKLKAFSGAGHTLGSPVPRIFENVPVAAARIPSQPTFKVDETKPVTTIQIRLADGTRLISKFNHHNTVGDIKNLVKNARPGTGNFNLMTTFPNKVLTDDSITINDAKLLNAVVVQRMV